MKRMSTISRFLVGMAAFSLAAGCATTQSSSGGGSDSSAAAGAEARSSDGQPAGKALRLFEDALASYEEQKSLKVFDWALLEKKFQAAIAADDQFAEAHYNLGVIHERMRRPDEAMADYKKALQLKPYFKEPAENLAVILQAQGQTADAMALAQNMMKAYPDDGASRARLASIYQAAGDTKQAMHYAREALMRDPKSLTAYKVMMNCYLDRNNLDMARLVALRATKLNAEDPELYYTMGLIMERQDDQPGAIYQYMRAVQVRDDFIRAHVRIAQIATKNSDWSTAAAHYQKIVQYAPESQEARLNLGICYKGLGEVDKAMAEYDAILKSADPLPLAYFAMGVLFQAHKDSPEKALENYKEYVARSRTTVPANHPVFEKIRECEQAIREAAEAKAAEEKAAREAELERQRQEEQKRIEEENQRAAQKAQEEAEKAAEEAEKAERQKAAQALLDGKSGEGAETAPAAADGNGAADGAGDAKPADTAQAAPAPAPATQPAASAAESDEGDEGDDEDEDEPEDGPEE